LALLGSFKKLFGSKEKDERTEIEAKLKTSPNDPQLFQRLGLLLVRQRDVVAGVAQLARAAELFEKDGFAARAIAVLRQLLRSDPGNVEMHQRLIALLSSQGLSSDAVGEFERFAKDFIAKLPDDQQSAYFSRIAELLPGSPIPRLCSVDVHLREHNLFEAVNALEKAAGPSVESGDVPVFLDRLKAVVSAAAGQPEHLEFCGFLAFRVGNGGLGMTLFKQMRAAVLSAGDTARLSVIDRVMAAAAVGWDVAASGAESFEEAAALLDSAPAALAAESEPEAPEVPDGVPGLPAGVEIEPESAAEEDEGMVMEALGRLQAKVDEEIGDSDFETRYNLGIAYKEMGLLDEAVKEFRLAARRADLRVGAVTLLADVVADQGNVAGALEELDGLLVSGILDASGKRDVRYHKAILLERNGHGEEAAAIFRALADEMPGYRDVRTRVGRA
jgi:tetratricopeptide (TPR) repeat protein